MDEILLMERAEILKAFGRRVKALRKQKGWTQKELAAKVGVRYSQLNKYESGLHAPPPETLLELAGALDATTDYLLAGDTSEEVPLHSPRLLDRFRELEGFSSEDQEAVLKLIDAMIVQHRLRGVVSGSTLKAATSL